MDPNTATQPVQDIHDTEHSAPVAWPPRSRSRRPLFILIGVAVALLVIGGGAVAVLRAANVGPFRDSGLAFCASLADDSPADSSDSADGVITKAEYLRLRGKFTGSRYDDLRETGTAFADNMWRMSGRVNNPSPSMQDLEDGRALVLSLRALKSACADHGYVAS